MDGPDELGYYTAYNKDHKYTHLKEDALTPLSNARYDDIEGFHEGFAVVQLGDVGFHIKPDGSPAYPQRYNGIVMPFENGRAEVFTNGPPITLVKVSDNKIKDLSKN